MASKNSTATFKCAKCTVIFRSKSKYVSHDCGTTKPATKKTVSLSPPKFICDFCGKGYRYQNAFESHTCDNKIRYINRDEQNERVAFQIYQYWYKATTRKEPTIMDFVKSQLYDHFLKFSEFVIERNPPNRWKNYVDWLIKKRTVHNEWYIQKTYDEYIVNMLKTEDYIVALNRSLDTVSKYCVEKNISVSSFMETITPPRMLLLLETGRISPWLLLLSKDKNAFMTRLSEDDGVRIHQIVKTDYWFRKFNYDASRKQDAIAFLRKNNI